jgi:hypothetical protein
MPQLERSPFGTRGWPRQPIACTTLAAFAHRECLGKTLDLSEGGAGAILQGAAHRVGERVKLVVVFEGGTLAFRGSLAHVNPQVQSARVGIRFDSPGNAALRRSARFQAAPNRFPEGWVRKLDRGPARFNVGLASPLVASDDALALRRDASRLVRALRRKGLPVGRITYDSLLQLIRERRVTGGLNRVSRELFRTLMQARYPSFPGSAIRGRIAVVGDHADSALLAGATVMLDRFSVAQVGPCGSFLAEGVPVPDAPVLLSVSIRGPGLVTTDEVLISLRAGQATSVFVEVPVRRARGLSAPHDELERAYRDLCSFLAAGNAGG